MESILYQDNKSAMLLEKNRKTSSSSRMKHINVRYYFIKDRIKMGGVVVKHCNTELMLADHFTKALQGILFKKFWVEVMNLLEGLDNLDMVWEGYK